MSGTSHDTVIPVNRSGDGGGHSTSTVCSMATNHLPPSLREIPVRSSGNATSESKFIPTAPVHVLSSALPLTASPVSVTLSVYDRKTNWVYKTRFSIVSEVNVLTEGVNAYQLAASLKREAVEVLQTLPNKERRNLNSLYNALDLRFGQKYSKEYARLQMKTTLENRRKFAGICLRSRKTRELGFSDHKATATTQASCRERHSIRGARSTADASRESPWTKEIHKLKKEVENLMVQLQNQTGRRIKCWSVVNQSISKVTSPETIKKILEPSAGDAVEQSP
ncbi:uncharacterized protein TNCV_3898901 [Trichonephila clavipes]|nr:uncharacterized protein TNCV_3898901 [Trichonephila clavipes]